MLNAVPIAINLLTRRVLVNHPNTYDCELYRKVVTRVADGTVDGNPTLGGLGVLDTADEEQFEYVFLGLGYALPADRFATAPMVDRNDANIGAGQEFRFLIEPFHPSGHPESFEVRTHDVLMLLLGDDPASQARLAFEVVGRDTMNNIPPYSVAFVTNRRDDLHIPVVLTENVVVMT